MVTPLCAKNQPESFQSDQFNGIGVLNPKLFVWYIICGILCNVTLHNDKNFMCDNHYTAEFLTMQSMFGPCSNSHLYLSVYEAYQSQTVLVGCCVCLLQELDLLAAELNNLAACGGSSVNNNGAVSRPLVEDDDSDDEAPPATDGTLLASEPPKPLYVYNDDNDYVVLIKHA